MEQATARELQSWMHGAHDAGDPDGAFWTLDTSVLYATYEGRRCRPAVTARTAQMEFK